MSPFEIVVILSLTVLFVILSVIPLLPGQPGKDCSQRSPGVKTKPTQYRALRKTSK
jgi:hypothetical protein